MKSIDEYDQTLVELNKYVGRFDERVRAEVFKFLLAQEFGLGSSKDGRVKNVVPMISRGTREIAPQELLRSAGRSKLTDRAIILGYFLETLAGKQSFSSGDLKGAFESAREKAPKNPSDIVASLERDRQINEKRKSRWRAALSAYRLSAPRSRGLAESFGEQQRGIVRK